LLKQHIIENWLLKHSRLDDKSLVQTQIDQAYARLAFACAGLLYLYLHADAFSHYQSIFLSLTAIYFICTILSIPAIKRTALSAYRALLFPLFDTFVVIFAMLIDGGPSSGLYFILLVIIFGNSFRFGNAMLWYSQFTSLVGLLLMTVYAENSTTLVIDYTLFSWQTGALLVIPLYIYLISNKAEDALKMQTEAEESSFHLMDKGPLPIFTFELDDDQMPQIMYTNSAMQDLFQHKCDLLIKPHVDIIAVTEDAQELVNFCRSIFNNDRGKQKHTAQNIYIRGQDCSGNILKLMCSAILMRWRSQWIGVCFIFDVTQRETMQEELESVHRYAYISTLVAGIVHDFRNVLTNMIGYAEVMQMNSHNSAEQEQLESIIAAGERGSELITHLLKLGNNRSDSETVSSFTPGHTLPQPLKQIIGLARLQLPQYIQLQCDIESPLHDVSISSTEIEQLLLNLINNSTQAISKAGHIEILIRNEANHRLAKPEHPCLLIQVSDNGIGIAPENLETIFKPFWTSKSKQGGSGLGLTMVERIIKRNHGCIEVKSIANQTTVFSIYLPPYIHSSEQSASNTQNLQHSDNKAATQQLHDTAGYHALVVDDVADILKIHQAMLAHMDITSETAQNGQNALAMLQQKDHPFDLIITDYKMPVMDGLKLVKHIRQFDNKLPILMISAFGEDHQLQQAIDYNVTLLNKPINMDKLKEAIAKTLTRHR